MTNHELESKVETIGKKMFRRRLSSDLSELNSWKGAPLRDIPKRDYEGYIRRLIDKGFLVTAGYFSTAVRGYHDYWIFHKERKLK